jgi:NAD(P)-dependent dehydrogenase (short-subunit alcohol dehydrogenase family)
MSSFKVEGSVAFVTGTNKPNGIGRALVEALLEKGASKVYATARKASELDELVSKHNGKVVAVALDVTDLDAIAELPKSYPDVSLLVNNAGYATYMSSLGDLDNAKLEMLVNYIAPMAIVKAFADVLPNQPADESTGVKSSAIVNINSIASFINFPICGPYSASKAAAHSITQAQRRDIPNSLVIGVYPGPIDTDMAKDVRFDKTSPSDVAVRIIEALSDGTEDVFPDPMAQQMIEGFKADFKAMERQMIAMAAGASSESA